MVDTILPAVADAVCVTKRGRRIIGPISHTFARQGVTVVLGPNGAGKTTLLRMLHGIERVSAGSITWQLPMAQAALRQAFVFQTPTILRRRVIDNIAYPMLVRGVPKTKAREAAARWATQIGLGAMQRRQARFLSGGEKQKLALARALIMRPDVLFLDEATTNLDGRSTREIEDMLKSAAATGTRIFLATHDLGQARRLATDVVFIYNGKLHDSGQAEAFFARPNTAEAAAYLQGDIVE